jgi:hypothetical protein
VLIRCEDLVEQGGQGQAVALAGRDAGAAFAERGGGGQVGGQADGVEGVGDVGGGGADGEEVGDRPGVRQRWALRQIERVGGVGGSGVDGLQAGQHAEDGRLAGAGRAGQGDDLARSHDQFVQRGRVPCGAGIAGSQSGDQNTVRPDRRRRQVAAGCARSGYLGRSRGGRGPGGEDFVDVGDDGGGVGGGVVAGGHLA